MNQQFSMPLTPPEQAILDALEQYVLFGHKPGTRARRHRMELALALPTGELIVPPDASLTTFSLAVVAHIFYDDMCGQLARSLVNLPFPFTLLISTDTGEKKAAIERAFAYMPNMTRLDVRVTPNRGRNIAPLLVEFGAECLAHDFVLHVHSKKSPYGAETHGWLEHSLDHLLHSPLYVESVFRLFVDDPRLGVFSPPPFPSIAKYMVWAEMKQRAHAMLRRMQLPVSLIESFPLDFPAGAMMVFRPSALAPLLRAGLTFDDFPEECGQMNDTLAHVVERLVFYIAHHRGFRHQHGRPASTGEYFRPLPVRLPSLPAHISVSDRPEVSIVVPVFDQWNHTAECLASVRQHTHPGRTPFEIIVADDGSSDDTVRVESHFPGVRRITTPTNLGFLRNCNFAASQARGKYILFLNNDTHVQPRWLDHLLDVFGSKPDAAIVGAKLVYPNGKLQEAGGVVMRSGGCINYGRNKRPSLASFCYVKECDYVSGAAMLVDADFFRSCGGFDERFAPAYYEDTDLAFQARSIGRKVYFQPASIVVHYEGGSHGTDVESGVKRHQKVNRDRFVEKWASVLADEHGTIKQLGRARERSFGRTIVAVFDQVLPEFDRHAGARYTFDYMRLLLEKGFVLKYFCAKVEEGRQLEFARALEQMGVETHYPLSIGMEQNWSDWILDHAGGVDVFWLNRPHIAYRHMLACKKAGKPIIYFCHDLQSMRERREAQVLGDRKQIQAAALRERQEVELIRGASVAYTPSTFERDYLAQVHGLDNVIAHPVYLFDKTAQQRTIAPPGRDVIFVGGMRHRPNLDGILWFVDDVWPAVLASTPDARLHVVGTGATSDLTDRDGANIVVHGGVCDDRLAALYAESRAAIVPLRYGAGVKGKFVEALRHALPVVSTAIGIEGVADVQGRIEPTDTPGQFAAALVRILQLDEDAWLAQANALSQFGHEGFSKQRGWDSLRAGFERIGLSQPEMQVPVHTGANGEFR